MLDDKKKKSRYSLSYLYAVCAQAGFSAFETRQDEDVDAIDAYVKLKRAPVAVQLKCTSSPKQTQAGYRVDFEDGWTAKWEEENGPVFVVLVVVPRAHNRWLDHTLDVATLHRTVAFWGVYAKGSNAKSMTLKPSDRLTAQSMDRWQAELDRKFEGGFSA